MKFKTVRPMAAFLITMALFQSAATRTANAVDVAASVAPIHSLVAMVSEGVAEPSLIVRSGASPHDYALKPSEASALDRADLVFWIGEGLEPWMAKAVVTLAGDAEVIELGSVKGVTQFPFREGGNWGDHGHHEEHQEDEHHDTGIDPHLWLDPENAAIWLNVIAGALAEADPENTEVYHTNAASALSALKALEEDIEHLLAPVKEKPYVVFHDAYQYYERRFGLHPVGAISLGDADRPGPARLVEIREVIAHSQVRCIFTEPQFEPKLVETVIEGSDVETGVLDPIGAGLKPGPDLYPALLHDLAVSLADCLG